jgi:hypothetical protein
MAKTEQMFHMRMPKALHRRLSREAKHNSLTLSGEILRRLELSLRMDMAYPDQAFKEAGENTPEKYYALAQEALDKHKALFHAAAALDTLLRSEAEQKVLRETLVK